MEDEVQAQVAQEAEEKWMKILALQDAIAELREQKVMELRNKEILKHKLDQVYLWGATNVEMKALKESQQTLNCKWNNPSDIFSD